MKQKGLAQAIVATVCVLATCMPCGSALAVEQTGTGVTDVTVQQVAPKDDTSDKDNTTLEALDDVRDVANGNVWIVAPITGDASKKPVRTSVQPIPKTGDENLVGIAAACGGIGAVLSTIALMMRKNESKGIRDEENQQH